jgi:hypothetical protein
MESDSDEEFSFTPPTIRAAANSTYQSLLPEKSKSKYELAYSQFMKWKLQNKITIISENVMTAYMRQLSERIKPSTLWTTYSMLRTTLSIKENVDISKCCKLRSFLKLKSSWYKSKKSCVLSSNQIKQFINEAPT